jgi:uncharacterized protein YjiS (DUF1127 family)
MLPTPHRVPGQPILDIPAGHQQEVHAMPTIRSMFRRLVETMAERSARNAQRRLLLELDDRELMDIGITRTDAYREAMRRERWL